jgi:hypothetical protein
MASIRKLTIDPLPPIQSRTIELTGRYRCRLGANWRVVTVSADGTYYPQGPLRLDSNTKTWRAHVDLGSTPTGVAQIAVVEVNPTLEAMVEQYFRVAGAAQSQFGQPLYVGVKIPESTKVVFTVASVNAPKSYTP